MATDITIIGAGYVGLPLAVAFAEAGRRVHCLDTDPAKVAAIGEGRSYIADVDAADLARLTAAGTLTAGDDYAAAADTDDPDLRAYAADREPRAGRVGHRRTRPRRSRPPAPWLAGGAGVDHVPGTTRSCWRRS
jgi:glycine/D-amino acid oxidase-like deaminating enzyme